MTRHERITRWRDRWEQIVAPHLRGVSIEVAADKDMQIVGYMYRARVPAPFIPDAIGQDSTIPILFLRVAEGYDGLRYMPEITVCRYPLWATRPLYKARNRVAAMMEWRPVPTAANG